MTDNQTEIALMLGRTDHTTVRHSIQVCKDYLDTDEKFKEQYDNIYSMLYF